MEPSSRTGRLTDWTPEVRVQIERRSNGRCEARCSPDCAGWGTTPHHRKLRRHGDHSAENGLWVCPACHDLIHKAGDVAYEAGMLVRSVDDPAVIRVRPGPFPSD